MGGHRVIPVKIDVQLILAELAVMGWRPYKIEMATGLSRGYITLLRTGRIEEPVYSKAARLHNFWECERERYLAEGGQLCILAQTT